MAKLKNYKDDVSKESQRDAMNAQNTNEQEAIDYLNSIKELLPRISDPNKLLQIQQAVIENKAHAPNTLFNSVMKQIGDQYTYFKKYPVVQPDADTSTYQRRAAPVQDTNPQAGTHLEGNKFVDSKGSVVGYQDNTGAMVATDPTAEIAARQSQNAKDEAATRGSSAPETPDKPPVYDYNKDSNLKDIEAIIKERLVKPQELPEMVTKYQDFLNKANAPFEEQAVERLKGEFSAVSPLSYGSGKQMEATRELIREQEASKAATALAMGKTEYESAKSDYNNALNMALGIAEYKDKAAQLTTDQERQDYWNMLSRKWNLEDVSSQRDFANATAATARTQQLEDYKMQDEQYWKRLMEQEDFTLTQQDLQNKRDMQKLLTTRGWQLQDALTARNQSLEDYKLQKQDAIDIANAGKPADVPWWQQLLTPIATGAGYVIGGTAGAAGAKALTGMFTPKTTQPYTGALARPVETAYDYTKPYDPTSAYLSIFKS